ncbi:MAG: hypothetical protein RSA29_04525 [Clostridium sp.]|uniref:hypothetical protein n=1 Tax=Clostridium sp. TaxID=1506 RepID=UPI00306477B0
MQGKRDVLSYMNSHGRKQYTKYQLSAISTAIKIEPLDRAEEGLVIKTRSKKGREILNQRIADIANKKLYKDKVTAHDVWVFKKCNAEEYQDRTGKCAWGFKEVRKKLGFDEETGLELEGD